ncbi:MAG TPA: YlxM family DNA-binding protein [Bacillota bacterium]|jgi:hypothetical protein|nr:YlxM family DNA-binding protein [Bacillota bacterium]
MLRKMLRMAALFDVYGPLLTERQQEMCRLYYLNDYSLSEISELHVVSRQAVHDTLVRSEQAMEEYENQFGLVRSSDTRRLQLEELTSALSAAREALDSAVRALGPEIRGNCECDLDAVRAWLARAIEAVEGCQKAAISMDADTGTGTVTDTGTGMGTDLGGDHAIGEKEGGL